MEIKGNGSAAPPERSERSSSKSGAGSATSAGKSGTTRQLSDEFKMSPSSVDLASKEAPLDASKVSSISQAIRDGRFQVNSEQIAQKLIDGVREMVGQRTS